MAYICSSYIDRLLKNKKVYTNAGSEMFDQYEYRDVNGVQTLVLVGSVNRQEEIQSYAKSCDISNILNRFMNGEIDLLNKAGEGFYADVRNMPLSYADYFDRVEEAKRIFNDLSPDIKKEFNNDAESFFRSFGSSEFKDKIAILLKKDGNTTSDSASVENEGGVNNAE